MRATYAVSGMNCDGCVRSVTEALSKVPGVSRVEVTLKPPRVQFESDAPIIAEVLNAALQSAGSFRVHQSSFTLFFYAQRIVKKFRPLILMFSLVLAWTIVSQVIFGFHLEHAMHQFMGAFFLLFGGLKVINWKRFVPAYRAYDDVAKRSALYAWAYPGIEIGLAAFFLTGTWLVFANVITFILMTQKAVSVHRKLALGGEVQCACLGGFFNIPVTRVTFFEDVLMAAMAAYSLSILL